MWFHECVSTLIIVCGLPGSGKTTRARALAEERSAIRMNPDEWLAALDISVWDEATRARIEALQWRLGEDILRSGGNVIIEWGTWGRDERDALRTEAHALGARVELLFLDAPVATLWQRIHDRGAEDPPITREQIEEWNRLIQRPDAEEFALYDAVL